MISGLGSELYERICKFIESYSKVGASLEKATDSFNASVATLESRVLVSAKKFKELGISSQSEVQDVVQIEKLPRTLALPISLDEENKSK